jgi:hypothetical protein
LASAKVITVSSVTGEITDRVSFELGLTHLPPMKNECGALMEKPDSLAAAFTMTPPRLNVQVRFGEGDCSAHGHPE